MKQEFLSMLVVHGVIFVQTLESRSNFVFTSTATFEMSRLPQYLEQKSYNAVLKDFQKCFLRPILWKDRPLRSVRVENVCERYLIRLQLCLLLCKQYDQQQARHFCNAHARSCRQLCHSELASMTPSAGKLKCRLETITSLPSRRLTVIFFPSEEVSQITHTSTQILQTDKGNRKIRKD